MNSNIQIIDDLLDNVQFNNLLQVVDSTYFPWFTSKIVYESTFLHEEKYNMQLSHLIYSNNVPQSNHFSLLGPFIEKLNIASLYDAKFNMNLCSNNQKIMEHSYHIDNDLENCCTAVYYLNTNDGYTIFEDGNKVSSVANRVVVFPSKLLHSGTNCTNTKCRYVLNINYFSSSN